MSPQRVAAAAATVSPYPFDARQAERHHGQGQPASASSNAAATTTAPENAADRGGSHVKGKKTKKSRAEREARREEEIRFNIGPRNIRPPQAARGGGANGRRVFRMPGRTYPEDQNGIPDYPPPSFQEAMTTPPVSVCSSTTSLPLAPATTVPLHIPENIPEDPCETTEQTAVPPTAKIPPSDDDLDFEGTMFVIDRNSVPVSCTDLPKGVALEERVKSDWLKRRGVEFPGKGGSDLLAFNKSTEKFNVSPSRGRTLTKQLAPLLIDPDPKEENLKSDVPSPVNGSKRRFLSLSPLRTIFPPRSPTREVERATLSAHPSPSSSPYHTSRSLFFRSSTSLATSSILKLPLLSSPASGKGDNLSRKVFKGKASKSPRSNVNEPWEVVEEDEYSGVDELGVEKAEHPPSLLSAIESIQSSTAVGETSPTRSQSFTFGTQVNLARARRPLVRSESPDETGSSMVSSRGQQESVLRDWKGPSTAFIDRPLSRSRSPTPVSAASESSHSVKSASHSHHPELTLAASISGPTLTTVRGRPTFPSSSSTPSLRHTAQVTHPSPLRVDANMMAKKSTADVNIYQQALDTPLPVTPVVDNRFDTGGRGDLEENITIGATSFSGRHQAPKLTNPNSASVHELKPVSASLTILTHSNPSLAAFTSVANMDTLEEPMTPTRHHYAGRPLPRPPANASRLAVVDSMYASPESPIKQKIGSSYNNCPEGLLIDLDDTTLDTIPGSGASTPRSDEATFNSQLHPPAPMSQASSSSVDLLIDHPSFASSAIQSTSTPVLPTSPNPRHPRPPNSIFSELTDLDLLVSRLADDRRDGSDYETLLLVSELIGPATSSNNNNNHNHNPGGPSDSTSSPKVNPNGNMSLIGHIEVRRRRVTKEGVVKLKLTLLDVSVNKCGICLFQFRDQDRAALTSVCQHSFHERCVERWLARSKTCPLCRIPLDTDVR